MLRNRLFFSQTYKCKNLVRPALNLKLKAILPALLVAFSATATASNKEGTLASADLKTNEKEHFTVIAHRGASGYLPEHTLEAATLAFSLRPDFIEQDVVITKDNIPVVLHDIHLETVTNVEDVFPERHRDDARYYARDFTLEELRTLQIHERTGSDGKQVFENRYRGKLASFKIATLEEHLELIRELNRQFDAQVGVYPEVKSPAFHAREGIDASKIVIDTLNSYGFGGDDGNSYLQCFDFKEIKRIRENLGYKGKVVMLIGENEWGESDTDYDWVRTQEGMREVASYADGIGPWLGHVLNNEAMAQGKIEAAAWLKYAHQNKLTIHPYTYRHDALPTGMTGEQTLELLENVVHADGVFTDHLVPVLTWREKQN